MFQRMDLPSSSDKKGGDLFKSHVIGICMLSWYCCQVAEED
jgi:hypothetical protein